MTQRIRVLFICVANAARSQLAEALLRHTDSERFEAFSAGTEPREIDPRTLAALAHLTRTARSTVEEIERTIRL